MEEKLIWIEWFTRINKKTMNVKTREFITIHPQSTFNGWKGAPPN